MENVLTSLGLITAASVANALIQIKNFWFRDGYNDNLKQTNKNIAWKKVNLLKDFIY